MTNSSERPTSGYQTFDDAVGSSDSPGKLRALQLPTDLTGKRVLDIGCNEGFFAMAAKDRGAAHVAGIDSDRSAIERAQGRRHDIEFLNQSWETLPDGPWDLILMLSAIHYEPNPRALLNQIENRLSADGLLVLECGVSSLPGNTVEWTQRPIARDDVIWYPSRGLLIDRYLHGFAVREVGPSVEQPGDQAARVVFHCRPRRPIVLLVPGRSKIGKTALTRELAKSATMTLEVDRIVYALSRAVQRNTRLLSTVGRARESGCDIGQTMRMVEREGLAHDFADLVATQIVSEEPLIVVEGYGLTALVVERLREVLRGRAVVWLVDRLIDAATQQSFEDASEAELVYLQSEVLRLRAERDLG